MGRARSAHGGERAPGREQAHLPEQGLQHVRLPQRPRGVRDQVPDGDADPIGLYERAKQWIVDHPDDAAKVLADEAQIDIAVARRELVERMNFKTSGVPGDAHIAVLKAVVPIINAEQLANPGSDVTKAVTDLIEGSYAKAVVK